MRAALDAQNLPDKSFCLEVQQLKRQLDIIDPQTGKDRYPKWTHFENRVLLPSEQESSGKADLTFSCKGLKEGRSATQIEFTMQYQPREPIVAYEGPNAAVFGRLLTHFGLRPDQAHQLIAQYSLTHINQQLHKIQLRVLNGELENAGAYTAKLFGV